MAAGKGRKAGKKRGKEVRTREGERRREGIQGVSEREE